MGLYLLAGSWLFVAAIFYPLAARLWFEPCGFRDAFYSNSPLNQALKAESVPQQEPVSAAWIDHTKDALNLEWQAFETASAADWEAKRQAKEAKGKK